MEQVIYAVRSEADGDMENVFYSKSEADVYVAEFGGVAQTMPGHNPKTCEDNLCGVCYLYESIKRINE